MTTKKETRKPPKARPEKPRPCSSTRALLRVHLRGSGVKDGRILLDDLVRFGRSLQTAVRRVATVLEGDTTSVRPGPRPERIRYASALEVVGMECGSVVLDLDLRRDQEVLFGMDPGEAAVRKLVEGMGLLRRPDAPLPAGYDSGVLAAVRDVGIVFDRDVDAVDFEVPSEGQSLVATYEREDRERIVRRIQAPVRNQRTVEGRLLMADFVDSRTQCRVHPPTGTPVLCEFDESLASQVQENLRGMVRVTGEAEEDPETHKMRKLRLVSVEPLEVGEATGAIDAEAFWWTPTVEELAAEQGVAIPQSLDALFGAGADLWASDAEFDSFLAEIETGRARAAGGGSAS